MSEANDTGITPQALASMKAFGITPDRLAELQRIDIPELVHKGEIEPDPEQPREIFDPAALAELSSSIIRNGQKTPIWVTPHANPDDPQIKYKIIAGERRWTAINTIDFLMNVKVIVYRGLTQAQIIELACIENCCRVDLTPLEKIRAIRKLHVVCGKTSEEISNSFGWNIQYVDQHIRLGEKLHPDVLGMMDERRPDELRLRFPAALYLVPLNHESQLQLAPNIVGKPQNKARMIVADFCKHAPTEIRRKHSQIGHSWKGLVRSVGSATTNLGFYVGRDPQFFAALAQRKPFPERHANANELRQLAHICLKLATQIDGRELGPIERKPLGTEQPVAEQSGSSGQPIPLHASVTPDAEVVSADATLAPQAPAPAAATEPPMSPADKKLVESIRKTGKIPSSRSAGHGMKSKHRRKFSRAGKDPRGRDPKLREN